MIEIVAIILVNLFVGMSVGICGIAGFLLPIFYLSVLNYPLDVSLMLSFIAFFVSGIVGVFGYKKHNNLNIKIAIKLGIFSIIGAFIGSKINLLLNPIITKQLLYAMVLFSGLMLVFRKNKTTSIESSIKHENQISKNNLLLFAVGIISSTICSLTGAGGPVLVVPTLVLLGIRTQTAIGIALFQSIFIAIPSIINYGNKISLSPYYIIIIIIIIFHGIGVLIGSKISPRINHNILKKIIAYSTIFIAIFLFLRL